MTPFGKNYRTHVLATSETLALIRPAVEPIFAAIQGAVAQRAHGQMLVKTAYDDFLPRANFTYTRGMEHVEAAEAVAAATAGALFAIVDTLVAEIEDPQDKTAYET